VLSTGAAVSAGVAPALPLSGVDGLSGGVSGGSRGIRTLGGLIGRGSQ
jgi:hypothetical protein